MHRSGETAVPATSVASFGARCFSCAGHHVYPAGLDQACTVLSIEQEGKIVGFWRHIAEGSDMADG